MDALQSELLPRPAKEIHRSLRRFVRRPEFNAHRLAEQVGEVFLHFTIQYEGDVGIELFLELIELLLAKFPGAGLEHRQDKDILTSIVGKGIQHAGSLDSRARRGPILGRQIFAEGNHT